MKRNSILFYCLAWIFISCGGNRDFIKFSNELYSSRISKTKLFLNKEKHAREIRKKLFKSNKIEFFSIEEQLFIIEGHDLESDLIITCIFNSIGEVNYKYDNDEFQLLDKSIFTKKIKGLILDWKIEEIKNRKNKEVFGALDIFVEKVTFNSDCSIKLIERFSFSQNEGDLIIE